MKKILLSATALSFALTASALAADLPSHKAPIFVPPPPPPMWTGFYAGLNAGYSWSNSNHFDTVSGNAGGDSIDEGTATTATMFALSGTGSANVPMSGFIGGGQIGYNYQMNNFVFGIETDIQGAGIRGSGGFTGAMSDSFGGDSNDIALTGFDHQKTVDWLGTVRGRLGYLFTPTVLLYATGGLAYGGVEAKTHVVNLLVSGDASGTGGGGGRYTQRDTNVGWTVGAGVEWMFAPNFSIKAEYLFYDLGSLQHTGGWFASDESGEAFGQVTAHHTHFDGHIVRLGLNYHLNFGAPAPVLAKY